MVNHIVEMQNKNCQTEGTNLNENNIYDEGATF